MHRPTFKTATLNSRTQLKQQLQREQLQELERQELERRENERKQSSMQSSSAGCTSIDHNSQIAHSSHSTGAAAHQLQVPRNCTTSIPQLYASSPTPSTSTDGSDFASGHFSNQSNPMPHTDHSNAPLKVPLHIGVDLPPQVLKVSHISNAFCFNFAKKKERSISFALFCCRFERCWRIRPDIMLYKNKRTKYDNI